MKPVPHPRRRLLFLLPFPPRLDGTHGGARVAASLIHALAAHHDVACVYFRAADEPRFDEHVAARCAVVVEVPVPARVSTLTRIARRLAPLRGVPTWAAWRSEPAFARRAVEVSAAWTPDVVHFEYHVMGQYAFALRNSTAMRVLTQYEAGVLAAGEHLSTRSEGAPASRLEQRAWARFERRVMRDMDVVVVFSERDRAALAPLAGSTPIVRIPIGAALPATPLDPLGIEQPPLLVFIGNFGHPPNRDAAVRLAEAILPGVRAAVPTARLRIVGEAPPRRVAGVAGVETTGVVADVAPHLNDATLVVVPLRVGGGMRVKVLEALAHGKAVVASPRAVEGLDVESGVQLVVAETDEQFVAEIVRLLRAPSTRRQLAANARTWACTHLGERRWVADYEALYERFADTAETAGTNGEPE